MYHNKALKWLVMPALLAILVLSACATTSLEPTTAQEEVTVNEPTQAELEAQFVEVVYALEDAYRSNDVDRVMEFYADDVVTILPGMAPLEGKEAVRADWEYFFDTYTFDRDSELVYVNVDGDSAVRRMSWTNTLTPKDGSDAVVDTGNCIVGFKKVDDQWKIAWEMSATYDPAQQ